jgi:uncharacterized membrane protein YbaN (DUF454 family)
LERRSLLKYAGLRDSAREFMPDQSSRRSQSRRPAHVLWRPTLFVLGWLFLIAGIVGLFLPLLPGTVFLILSAACFTRSSPRFETWLLTHPTLGPPVKRWRAEGAIPRRAKVLAVLSLALSWIVVYAADTPALAKAACLVVFCAVAGYIVTRPDG